MKGLRVSMKQHIEQDWMENIPLTAVEAYLTKMIRLRTTDYERTQCVHTMCVLSRNSLTSKSQICPSQILAVGLDFFIYYSFFTQRYR